MNTPISLQTLPNDGSPLGGSEDPNNPGGQSPNNPNEMSVTLIQTVWRGYLARKKYTEMRFDATIKDLKNDVKIFSRRLTRTSERIETSWRRQMISQREEISRMLRLQSLHAKLAVFNEELSLKNLIGVASQDEIDLLNGEFKERITEFNNDLKKICQDSGFHNLKKGLAITFGDQWKSSFNSEALKFINDFNTVFIPLGYTLATVEYSTTIPSCEIVTNLGDRVKEKGKRIQQRIPYFTMNRVFRNPTGLEVVHGAELNIPYQDSEGKPAVMIVRGHFTNDPINSGRDIDLVAKRLKVVEPLVSEDPLPDAYKDGYLTQYPLRDLILKTPQNIIKEMNEDWEFLRVFQKGALPSIVKKFTASDLQKQVKIMSILLMMDSTQFATYLWEMLFKEAYDFQQIIRNTMHYSLQKKLQLAVDDLEEMKAKLKGLKATKIPYETRIAQSGMSDEIKEKAMEKLESVKRKGSDSEKDTKYLNGLLKIPFGKYTTEPVTMESSSEEISKYLDRVSDGLDKATYGQDKPKRGVITWLAQRIANGESKGECIALEGPPGTGKTTLAKEGIAKALNRPIIFISLSGQSDSSYLAGHGQTYIGSIWGRIVDAVMSAGRMDPVIFIDEVDKISKTDKGRELIGVLIALTDFTQNKAFQDQYFSGIDFDLSRALFVFSYNNAQDIDPILKDRMTVFDVKPLSIKEKIVIAKNYLMPEILKSTGFKEGEIIIEDDVIKYIIENYTFEAGARRLKENLFAIVRELNVKRLREPGSIQFPYKIDTDTVIKFREEPRLEFKKITQVPMVGMVNGLYATTAGIGGLTLIQTLKILGKEPVELTLTGSMGKVMQESMTVARTVAWNLVSDEVREKIRSSKPQGLHIHCPEGATPKDGPSAGGAITTAIVSQLTGVPVRNDVAMTGEIDLTGNITPIGGLSAKLQGAKKAGVKLALVPRGNEKDYNKIVKHYPELIDETFKVIIVDTIFDVLDNALVNNPIVRRPGALLATEPPPSDKIHCPSDDANEDQKRGVVGDNQSKRGVSVDDPFLERVLEKRQADGVTEMDELTPFEG